MQIYMQDGGVFDTDNPDPKYLTPQFLFDHMGRISRFNGHTTMPLSVLTHSLVVALLSWYKGLHAGMTRTVAADWFNRALIHDAAEVFYGDLTTPLKVEFPEIRAAVRDLQSKIYAHATPMPISAEGLFTIEEADQIALQIETALFTQGDRSDSANRKANGMLHEFLPGFSIDAIASVREDAESVYRMSVFNQDEAAKQVSAKVLLCVAQAPDQTETVSVLNEQFTATVPESQKVAETQRAVDFVSKVAKMRRTLSQGEVQ